YHAAALFALPWLVSSYQAAVQGAGPKGYIEFSAANRIDQLRHFVDRRREIGIGKQSDIGACGQQSSLDRKSLAPVFLVSDHLSRNLRVRSECFLGDLNCSISGAIVDDYDLKRKFGVFSKFEDLPERIF